MKANIILSKNQGRCSGTNVSFFVSIANVYFIFPILLFAWTCQFAHQCVKSLGLAEGHDYVIRAFALDALMRDRKMKTNGH